MNAAQIKFVRAVLNLVIGTEKGLEMDRCSVDVAAQFKDIQERCDHLLETAASIGEASSNEKAEMEKSSLIYLRQSLTEFKEAVKRGDAHSACRKSRQIHFGVAVIAVLGVLDTKHRDLHAQIDEAFELALQSLPADPNEVTSLYLNNIKYRHTSIKSLVTLDTGLDVSTVNNFMTKVVSGFNAYVATLNKRVMWVNSH